jgi:disulfide bond formation protein DsbB
MPSIPRLSPLALAALTLALPAAALAGAFAFQVAGFAPCELCLKERLPYYAGIVLGVVTLFLAWRGAGLALTACFAALALLFLGSAGFGAYHAGVEWGFWPGPADCTGSLERAPSMNDFMKQLQSIKVVRCDAVAIRILGLSLAGWNVVVSLAVAGLAVAGAARALSALVESPKR